ncbi:hypothetical protein RclHR1_02450005 [Rhizophagus clarus]|uniref:CxC2-like cysteine cluster KDZ transposase-associated domain-containing protein n=1 Tax=Rhizophagus clarus TaxID=94130 RepID=A0A2Z6R2C5_9GLOM|nr:hypothetical protein RclHR1_02450005 [Rhizophagus clarus]GES99667.1 hypothetical protein GLOIN_2v1792115 [Rhizophagus clarus]
MQQSESSKSNNKSNDLKLRTKISKEKIGPKHYRPYTVSFNNKDGGKTVINKYAKGSNKFKFSNQAKSLSNNKSEEQTNEELENFEFDFELSDNYESNNPKTANYRQKQDKLAANWKAVLDDIYNSILDNEVMPDNPSCFNCDSIATLKCLDCGPKIFYCNNCFNHFHNKINLFHYCIYLDNYQFNSNEIKLPQLCVGKCEHPVSKILTVFLKGWFYIQIPTCEGIIESLIKNRLFPASPCNPTLAFSFDVFDMYYQLLFEAQVSHLAFCKVLEAFQYQQNINRNIYSLFISAFHKYLGFKSKLQADLRKYYESESDNNFECPACPQPNENNITTIISFDGNFQLRRLKSSGNSCEDRLVNDRFIISEEFFSNWVSNNQSFCNNKLQKDKKIDITSCESNFKAADQLRSFNKSKFLDDTGIFGSTCRHGVPLKFLNLKKMGERYILAECLIDNFRHKFSNSDQKFIFLYDIACSFHAHISKSNNPLHLYQDRFKWAVSIFHAYAHTPSCQKIYHPRTIDSIGLTDGESLERLWSYLGKFVNITKYMKSNHRLDILGMALEHIYQKSIKRLANNLLKRFKNAQKVEKDSLEKLAAFEQQYQMTFQLIEEIIQKQKEHEYSFKNNLKSEDAYFEALMEFNTVNNNISKTNNDKKLEILEKKRLNALKKIENFELKLNILESHRWNPMDSKYSNYLVNYCINQLNIIINKLRNERNEYSFKTAYLYDKDHKGTKISTKIKISSANSISKINQLISRYNDTRNLLPPQQQANYPLALIKEVLNNQSTFWISLDVNTNADTQIPQIVIYNAIQKFYNLHRSKEEQNILKTEITRLVDFWTKQKQQIENVIAKLEKKNSIYYYLKIELQKTNTNLKNSQYMYNKIFEDNDLSNSNQIIESEDIEEFENVIEEEFDSGDNEEEYFENDNEEDVEEDVENFEEDFDEYFINN